MRVLTLGISLVTGCGSPDLDTNRNHPGVSANDKTSGLAGLPHNGDSRSVSAFKADFGTFLGGAAWERAQGVYIDSQGYIFIAGQTHSPDFPVTPGAFQTHKFGPPGDTNQLDQSDAFVAKLAPDGSRVIWATLLGGSRRDAAYAVRTDSSGNIYVVGATGSNDFPTTEGAYDTTFDGPTHENALTDIFVCSLSADGRRLLFSTFVGGASATEENSRGALYVDEIRGRIYVAGNAVGGTDFPTTPGAFQRSYAGGEADAFIFALSIDGSRLLHSTLLGGKGSDMAQTAIMPHPDGSLYVSGATTSTDFPTTPGAFQTRIASGNPEDIWWMSGDAFIVRISPDLDRLIFSSYYGGSDADATSHNQGLSLSKDGLPVLLGHTRSVDLPTTVDAYDRTPNGMGDGFVAIFSEDGSKLLHATYLGGSGDEEFAGISVGPAGNVYLTGATNSLDWPVTPGAHQKNFANGPGNGVMGTIRSTFSSHKEFYTGPVDAVFTVLNPDLSEILYSTYLGGSGGHAGGERGRGSWVDRNGHILVVGTTDSADFPVLSPSVQAKFAGDQDAFIMGFHAISE